MKTIPSLMATLIAAFFCSSFNARAQSTPLPFVSLPLLPGSAAPGGSTFTLTVNGTGFVSGSTVIWNKAPLATTFVNSSQLKATVTASEITTPSRVSVTVVNPGLADGGSNVVFFEVTRPTPLFGWPAASLTASNFYPHGVIAADLNGDGKLDLLWGNDQPYLNLSIGRGNGTFSAPFTLPYMQGNAVNVVAADFNGDGIPDAATTVSFPFSWASATAGFRTARTSRRASAD